MPSLSGGYKRASRPSFQILWTPAFPKFGLSPSLYSPLVRPPGLSTYDHLDSVVHTSLSINRLRIHTAHPRFSSQNGE